MDERCRQCYDKSSIDLRKPLLYHTKIPLASNANRSNVFSWSASSCTTNAIITPPPLASDACICQHNVHASIAEGSNLLTTPGTALCMHSHLRSVCCCRKGDTLLSDRKGQLGALFRIIVASPTCVKLISSPLGPRSFSGTRTWRKYPSRIRLGHHGFENCNGADETLRPLNALFVSSRMGRKRPFRPRCKLNDVFFLFPIPMDKEHKTVIIPDLWTCNGEEELGNFFFSIGTSLRARKWKTSFRHEEMLAKYQHSVLRETSIINSGSKLRKTHIIQGHQKFTHQDRNEQITHGYPEDSFHEPRTHVHLWGLNIHAHIYIHTNTHSYQPLNPIWCSIAPSSILGFGIPPLDSGGQFVVAGISYPLLKVVSVALSKMIDVQDARYDRNLSFTIDPSSAMPIRLYARIFAVLVSATTNFSQQHNVLHGNNAAVEFPRRKTETPDLGTSAPASSSPTIYTSVENCYRFHISTDCCDAVKLRVDVVSHSDCIHLATDTTALTSRSFPVGIIRAEEEVRGFSDRCKRTLHLLTPNEGLVGSATSSSHMYTQFNTMIIELRIGRKAFLADVYTNTFCCGQDAPLALGSQHEGVWTGKDMSAESRIAIFVNHMQKPNAPMPQGGFFQPRLPMNKQNEANPASETSTTADKSSSRQDIILGPECELFSLKIQDSLICAYQGRRYATASKAQDLLQNLHRSEISLIVTLEATISIAISDESIPEAANLALMLESAIMVFTVEPSVFESLPSYLLTNYWRDWSGTSSCFPNVSYVFHTSQDLRCCDSQAYGQTGQRENLAKAPVYPEELALTTEAPNRKRASILRYVKSRKGMLGCADGPFHMLTRLLTLIKTTTLTLFRLFNWRYTTHSDLSQSLLRRRESLTGGVAPTEDDFLPPEVLCGKASFGKLFFCQNYSLLLTVNRLTVGQNGIHRGGIISTTPSLAVPLGSLLFFLPEFLPPDQPPDYWPLGDGAPEVLEYSRHKRDLEYDRAVSNSPPASFELLARESRREKARFNKTSLSGRHAELLLLIAAEEIHLDHLLLPRVNLAAEGFLHQAFFLPELLAERAPLTSAPQPAAGSDRWYRASPNPYLDSFVQKLAAEVSHPSTPPPKSNSQQLLEFPTSTKYLPGAHPPFSAKFAVSLHPSIFPHPFAPSSMELQRKVPGVSISTANITTSIRWSSPTQLLIRPSLACLWESGRDPEFSNGYGRMWLLEQSL
ncbi:hypothetical protein CCUS01_14125 [Colletotrichum cuscutae]|uniref:Uncharacterized protein n=1 Tax=Colletotrichum cuscutae TaxID=1209917 RepID=A0AAI9Y9Y5_9PEZI|nr:hypothetical protein CCUS01_14125 [Colletotrichum cuscutae]